MKLSREEFDDLVEEAISTAISSFVLCAAVVVGWSLVDIARWLLT